MTDSLLGLITEAYNIKTNEDLEKRYYLNSIHKTYAEENNIIGHVAAVKRSLNNFGSSELKGSFIVDSVVTEERRRQGIYTDLYRQLETECAETDVYVSFPLQYELLNLVDRQNYEIVGEVKVFAKVLKGEDVVSKHPLLGKLANLISGVTSGREKKIPYTGIDIKRMTGFSGVNELWSSVKSDYPMMSVRDDKFLEARTRNRGYEIMGAYKDGRLTGYVIYKFIDRGQVTYYMIMDILSSSIETTEALYDYVYSMAKENNISLIGMWSNPKDEAFLKSKGFRFGRSTIAFIAKSMKSDVRVKDMSLWYLQPIEGEVY